MKSVVTPAASLLAAVMVACIVVPSAQARIGATVRVGTLGIGGDVTVGLTPRVNLRVAAQGGSLDIDNLEDNVPGNDVQSVDDLNVDIDLQSYMLLVDIHPFGGGFRLTGGVALNRNEFSVSARPGDLVEIGDLDYSVQRFSGSLTFNDIGGYLGIGVGNAVGTDGRWHVAMDVGVLYHGEPDVTLSATVANPLLSPLLARDLALEEADIEDEFSNAILYPVVSVGVSFAF